MICKKKIEKSLNAKNINCYTFGAVILGKLFCSVHEGAVMSNLALPFLENLMTE